MDLFRLVKGGKTMLNQEVDVIVDRKIHTYHPQHKDIFYEVNYGYVPNTKSSVDHEEIDAYILGENEPLDVYHGRVIAIIHRLDDEDKLVVANQEFSKEEIYQKTYFMEQYFKSHIEMAHTHIEDLLFDLRKAGFKDSDTVLLHSSLKSFGDVKGEDVLKAFKTYFKNGLVILPTHSWAQIREDNSVFDIKDTPSCVGALTNLALQDKDFKRSMHPTHSVCAFGKGRDEYLQHDLNQTTPVSPTGCFGVLHQYQAKIVFLGAPLSKNTFIHSIEEEMGVPDRFTDKIYHFISRGDGMELEYNMPRHYSTKRDHLSENYTKLLPHFLARGIAKQGYIGNSKTIIVDAKKCYLYVKDLLKRNIHLFDDEEDYLDENESNEEAKQ